MQERKKFKWAKSHVTLQKERLFTKALHAQKFFSTDEIFGLRTVLCYEVLKWTLLTSIYLSLSKPQNAVTE